MNFGSYLKNGIWDIVLCICASSALSFVMLTGFDSSRILQATPWIGFLVCAVISIYLYCIAITPTAAAAGGVALVIVICAATVGCWSASGCESILDDVVGNNAIFVVVTALCAIAVFIFSRRKTTTLILIGGGIVLCCAMEYLYFFGHYFATFFFGISATGLYAYRNYQQNLIDSESDKISFSSAVVASVLIAVLSFGLGTGIFVAAVAPLNPPQLIIKLLTKDMRLDEQEVRGVGDNVSVLNSQLYSINVNDTVISADGKGDKNQEENIDDTHLNPDSENTTQDAGSALNIDERVDNDAGEAVSTKIPEWTLLLIPFLVILAVAGIIGGRKYLRHRRVNGFNALAPGQRIQAFFLYFLSAFRKMKLPVPGNCTLAEYTESSRGSLCGFEQSEAEPEFNNLVHAYSAWAYGACEPNDAQVDAYQEYYNSFHHNARKQVGPLRYLVLFFRI